MEQKDLNKYLGYCRVIARSFWRKYPDIFSFDDLYGAAMEGLARGLNNLQLEKGMNRYLWEYIRGYTQNEVRTRLQDKSRCVGDCNSTDKDNPIEMIGVDPTQEEQISFQDMMENIKAQIDRLPPNERSYALLTLAGYNGTEIAEKMQVTPQYVCQLRKKVISTLQVKMRAA